MANDIIYSLIKDWKKQQPDWNTGAIGIVGRLMILGNLLTKRASKLFTHLNLGYTDFDVLATLRRQGSPFELTPTELRHAVLLSSGAMTACLDRLEQKSLIIRKYSKSDRRVIVIILTKKGINLVNKEAPKRFRDADEVTNILTTKEQQRLEELLAKLISGLP